MKETERRSCTGFPPFSSFSSGYQTATGCLAVVLVPPVPGKGVESLVIRWSSGRSNVPLFLFVRTIGVSVSWLTLGCHQRGGLAWAVWRECSGFPRRVLSLDQVSIQPKGFSSATTYVLHLSVAFHLPLPLPLEVVRWVLCKGLPSTSCTTAYTSVVPIPADTSQTVVAQVSSHGRRHRTGTRLSLTRYCQKAKGQVQRMEHVCPPRSVWALLLPLLDYVWMFFTCGSTWNWPLQWTERREEEEARFSLGVAVEEEDVVEEVEERLALMLKEGNKTKASMSEFSHRCCRAYFAQWYHGLPYSLGHVGMSMSTKWTSDNGEKTMAPNTNEYQSLCQPFSTFTCWITSRQPYHQPYSFLLTSTGFWPVRFEEVFRKKVVQIWLR